jgi:membrane protein implicated in regulation of membrane protease activity
MLATDPLSLIFIGCAAFAAAFLIIATVTGAGHGHMLHLGAHGVHIGHVGHVGHVAHTAHVAHVSDAATHTAHAPDAGQTATGDGGVAPQAAHITLLGALEQMVNLYGILVFLLIFGVLGYLLHNFGALPVAATLLLTLVVSLVCSGATSMLLARLFLLDTPRSLTRDGSRLAGRLAEVSMAVRGGGIGEVIYQGETGGRHSVGARSSNGEPITAGTQVVILDYADGIARIEPWDRFLARARADEQLPAAAPERHEE